MLWELNHRRWKASSAGPQAATAEAMRLAANWHSRPKTKPGVRAQSASPVLACNRRCVLRLPIASWCSRAVNNRMAQHYVRRWTTLQRAPSSDVAFGEPNRIRTRVRLVDLTGPETWPHVGSSPSVSARLSPDKLTRETASRHLDGLAVLRIASTGMAAPSPRGLPTVPPAPPPDAPPTRRRAD